MSTETLWHTLRSSWWMIALGAIIGLILGLVVLEAAPKQYESTSRVLVQPSGANGSGDLPTQQAAVTEMLPTYIAIAGSDKLLDATSERLDDSVDAATLRDELTYVAEEDAPIINVTGHGSSPKAASAMADEGSQTLADAVSSSYSGDLQVEPTIIEKASLPKTSSSPDPKILLPAGIVIGALVALVIALLRASRDRFPHSLRAIETAAGAPLLGILSPSDARIARAASSSGVPTTLTGIRGRLTREPHPVVALVDMNTSDGRARAVSHRAASLTTAGAGSRPELWRVPLTDAISTLPEDAVAVLLISEGDQRSRIARAALFCEGHGIALVGCIVTGAATPEQTAKGLGTEDAGARRSTDGHPTRGTATTGAVDTKRES